MGVERQAHVNLAGRKTEMRETSRPGLLMFEFFRVHEIDEFRPRRHRRDRAAPAERLRPKTTVTSETTHAELETGTGLVAGSMRATLTQNYAELLHNGCSSTSA
jgi:hypothetical protein